MRRPLSLLGFALVSGSVTVCWATEAGGLSAVAMEQDAFTYQRSGVGRPGSADVAIETGYGTRETRNFARAGVEQGLSVRLHPTANVAVELFAGRLVARDASQFAAEVRYRLPAGRQPATAVDLGFGLTRDYRGDTLPRLRVAATASTGAMAWSTTGNVELPLGTANRDELDVMVALGASYRASQALRLGVELAGEDLEGLVEEEEAEGGAKLLAGPSVRVELPSDLYLQANLSAVYAVAPKATPTLADGDAWGLSSRAMLGWQLP